MSIEIQCPCGEWFVAERKTAKYCSPEHKQRYGQRAKRRMRIPSDVRWRVLRRDEFRCVYCRDDSDVKKLRIDHIIPITKDGLPLALRNLITACHDCNAGKSDEEIDPREIPWWVHLYGDEEGAESLKRHG